MKLTIIGSSGAYPTAISGTTSYLLESDGFHMVIDLGSHTFLDLKEEVDPFDIDAVVTTHYHQDHIADIGVLQYYRQLAAHEDEKKILPIYGHDEDAQFKRWTIPNISEGCVYHEDDVLEIGPFTVRFMRTVHPVPTFALRIVERNTQKVFVFTADSGYTETLIPFAKGADLFMADTYFLNGHEQHMAHLTAGEAGTIANYAGVKQLVLTHLSERIDRELLQQQAEQTSHGIPVAVAMPHMVFHI